MLFLIKERKKKKKKKKYWGHQHTTYALFLTVSAFGSTVTLMDIVSYSLGPSLITAGIRYNLELSTQDQHTWQNACCYMPW